MVTRTNIILRNRLRTNVLFLKMHVLLLRSMEKSEHRGHKYFLISIIQTSHRSVNRHRAYALLGDHHINTPYSMT